jgi:EEF1A lysine methyltransferase 4
LQTVPVELADRGYRNQLCVDFSSILVERMKARYSAVDGLEWRLLDVRDMVDVKDQSVHIAFDKGTLDAMIHGSPWSPPVDVIDNTSKYMKEASVRSNLARLGETPD